MTTDYKQLLDMRKSLFDLLNSIDDKLADPKLNFDEQLKNFLSFNEITQKFISVQNQIIAIIEEKIPSVEY